jgi:hypothetical protein
MNTLLLLFDSTRAVIRAEKLCHQHRIPCKIIPVPKKISSECGMSIEISEEFRGRVTGYLRENGIDVKCYHPLTGEIV